MFIQTFSRALSPLDNVPFIPHPRQKAFLAGDAQGSTGMKPNNGKSKKLKPWMCMDFKRDFASVG
jgi:hypothetical protein